jgi:hypothetical protein
MIAQILKPLEMDLSRFRLADRSMEWRFLDFRFGNSLCMTSSAYSYGDNKAI